MVITLFLHAFFFVYEWGLTASILQQLRILPLALWGFQPAVFGLKVPRYLGWVLS